MGANDLAKTTDIDLSVRRWGNSLAVRLPAGLAKHLGLAEGSRIGAQELGKRLVASSEAPARAETLKTRLALLARLKVLHDDLPVTQPVSKDEMSRY